MLRNVRVGPIDYSIEFENYQAVQDKVEKSDTFEDTIPEGVPPEEYKLQKVEGCISFQETNISIYKDMKMQYQQIVVLHELAHAMNRQYCMNLTEVQCDQLAYAMLDLVQDNHHLIEWLWRRLP